MATTLNFLPRPRPRSSESPVPSTAVSSVIVVGNGPVGFRLLEKLCERNLHSTKKLLAFGEEPTPAYDRVQLTSLFQSESESSLEFAGREWYAERGIELRTGDPIVEIDRERRLVRSRSGVEAGYDTLILATGSTAFIPPIDGADQPGVFVYRTVDDVRKIREFSRNARSAAVIGGGLLGLEAARAMRDLGLQTHVVEMAPVLMPRQLDNDGAELLRQMIDSLGVHVHLHQATQRIRAEANQRVLDFPEGSLAVDMIVIAAGIRPRDELARQAALDVGPRGGIVVDDQLATSDPNIFAIGECALHRDTVYGLVAPGYHMADVVAANLSGRKTQFTGSDVSTRLKLLGVDVSLCGDYLNLTDTQLLTARRDKAYRKIVLRNGRIVGAVGVGSFPELPRVQEAIFKRRRIWQRQRHRFQVEGTLWPPPENTDVAQWPAGAIVCSCVGVTRGELTQAARRGCVTAEILAAATRASTVCGSCRRMVAEIAGAPPEPHVETPGWRWLFGASLATALIIALGLALEPPAWSSTVQSSWFQAEVIWRSGFFKQVTGFSLLGLTAAALLLSLRKRWKKLTFLNFGWWRAGHGIVGVLTLGGLLAHTGWRMGSNLNFWLMLTFLGINLAGALTGFVTAWESRASPEQLRLIRTWRPRLTMLHIVCFWPFPILIAFHIFAVFYL